MRKAPRIISRRKRGPQLKREDYEMSQKEAMSRDIDDEIGEDVIVQGGIMMRLVDDNDDEDEIHDEEPISSFQQFSRHITVEAPSLPYGNGPYKENPLPGTADEIESYPCSFCSDKPYLTDRGLLKHTETCHPEHLNQVLQDIAKIREEWERRYVERSRQRERIAIAKMRQDAISDAIANMAAGSSVDAIFDEYSDQGDEDNLVERSFEPCQICGILVNALHPSAMANHMRAHTKNDELRNQLIQTYGNEFVMQLTCHDCQLVFSDKRKLNAHIEITHSRKRKYVCKWCGTVCLSMSDLNTHKADVHGMPVSRSKHVQNTVSSRLQSSDRPSYVLGMKNDDISGKSFSSPNGASTSSIKISPILEDTPCKTTCEFCGLLMVKPSLLVRHMLRVHSRRCFTATIEVKGMPSIKVDVDGGKLTWWCCDLSFNNRFDYLYHRRACHQPKLEFSSYPSASVDSHVVGEGEVEEIRHRIVSEDGEIIRIGDTSGANEETENLYVLLVADPDEDDGKDEAAWGVMPMDGEVGANVQQIALTAEQYEQLRMQANGDLNNMQVMLMSEVVAADEADQVGRLACETPAPYISADALDSAVPVVDIDDGGPPTLQVQPVQAHGIPGISVIGHNDNPSDS